MQTHNYQWLVEAPINKVLLRMTSPAGDFAQSADSSGLKSNSAPRRRRIKKQP
jgi:hypothetical protein